MVDQNKFTNFIRDLGTKLSVRSTGTYASFIQDAPITQQQLQQVLGTNDEFLQRYRALEDRYYQLIADRGNLRYGQQVDTRLMKATGTIDFSILNHEVATDLRNEMKINVMRMDRIASAHGLPGAQLPSANKYRQSYKYMIAGDNQGPMHAGAILYNALNLTYNPKSLGGHALDSISFGGKLMSTDRLQGLSTKSRFSDIYGTIGAGRKTVLTFDSETTGVFDSSRVRSAALAETIYENGVRVRNAEILDGFNFLYDSPQFYGMNTSQGSFVDLIKQAEGFSDDQVLRTPAEFLDKTDAFLRKMIEADIVTGHNIGFDITKLTQSIEATEGFAEHSISGTLSQFYRNIEAGQLQVVDTLDVARSYLLNQVNESVSAVGQDAFDRASRFVENLYTERTIGLLEAGGKATYADVASIIANTNLLDRLAEDQGTRGVDLISKIAGGQTHAADVDVLVQNAIADYINDGTLQINSLMTGSTQTGNISASLRDTISRAKTAAERSSAITPTTNIADVSHLTATTSAYYRTERSLKRVSAQVTAQELGLSNLQPNQEGILRYTGEGYKFFYGSASEAVDEIDAKRALRRGVNLALGGNSHQIIDFGLSYATQASAEQASVYSASNITDLLSMSKQDTIDASGVLYRNFGTRPSTLDEKVGAFFGRKPKTPPFAAGVTSGDGMEVTEALARAGDPMAFLSDKGKIFSTLLSSATADLGMARATDLNTGFARNADLMTENGLSFFSVNTGANTKIFSTAPVDLTQDISEIALKSGPSRMSLPTQVLREALGEMGIDEFGSLKISTQRIPNAPDQTRLNLVLDVRESLSGSSGSTRDLMENVYNIMTDQDRLSRVLGQDAADFDSALTSQINKLRSIPDRQTAIDIMARIAEDNDIIAGFSDVSNEIIAQFDAANFQLDNDVVVGMRGRATTNRAVTGDPPLVRAPVQGLADFEKEVITVSGFEDKATLDVLDNSDRFAQASRDKIRYAEQASETIGANRGAVSRNIARGSVGAGENALLNMYQAAKPKMGMIGLAAGLAAGAYYMSKKNRETALLNETLEAQPYERGTRVDDYNNSSRILSYPPRQNYNDPLSTAGVVGRLDRSSIGHTYMGNRKNEHLFGGL